MTKSMLYRSQQNQETEKQDAQHHGKSEKDARAVKLAVVFFVLGVFFKFVLIGYQTIALVCFGLAVLTLLLRFLPFGWMRRMLVALTICGVLCLSLMEIPIVAASRGDVPNDADYLIVLGAGVNGTEPSLSLYHRLVAAEAWLNDHPDSIAILSGGQGSGEQITEAEAMYRWLVESGIEPARLYKEEASSNTRENFLYSATLLQSLDEDALSEPVAVVSSEYHLYRAKQFAAQAGIDALGVPAKTTWPILRLNYFLREGIAVTRLLLLGY